MTADPDNWLNAIHRDDTVAFKAFYQAYHLKLYRFMLALQEQPAAANDSLHRVMLDVWRHPKTLLGQPDIEVSLLQRGWQHISQHPATSGIQTRARVTHLELPALENQHQLPDSLPSGWHVLTLFERALIYLALIEQRPAAQIGVILTLTDLQTHERLTLALEHLRTCMVLPNSD